MLTNEIAKLGMKWSKKTKDASEMCPFAAKTSSVQRRKTSFVNIEISTTKKHKTKFQVHIPPNNPLSESIGHGPFKRNLVIPNEAVINDVTQERVQSMNPSPILSALLNTASKLLFVEFVFSFTFPSRLYTEK